MKPLWLPLTIRAFQRGKRGRCGMREVFIGAMRGSKGRRSISLSMFDTIQKLPYLYNRHRLECTNGKKANNAHPAKNVRLAQRVFRVFSCSLTPICRICIAGDQSVNVEPGR